ncbi:Mitochondrial succinate-fumarate transporter [Dimargaris cristalligena]|uniref:Succinate:fumarate antiporter n=1 Tax=Dimargaris cristalligena TaxID=215637 RepID=A0A4Q0A4D4_9FUNG|nr:Mitochondrial succinate-fumarate transporter [Dimargaris cristalligena]RKP40120.1 succinate:fumarate antiporter [Dimargaris cristalligena]|eukprot:RKP40120.1 succinate:fumarate antiporter [Dimargaris cristalligena]
MSKADGQRKSLSVHLIAGGSAGFMEALVCHPLDTIKVRMQLRNKLKTAVNANGSAVRTSFLGVGSRIVQNEGFLALYKGLGAVTAGIVPKMAIRFSSFEYYKSLLANPETGKPSMGGVFFAGLSAGVTEAVMVVTPMDVIKIRLQAQRHSMMDPLDTPKYRNAAHATYLIIKEEGAGALYKGVTLTALRQATNQAANFTAYQELKTLLLKWQPDRKELPSYQHLVIGGLSGAMGPLSNAPIDTIKTRIQKTPFPSGQSGFKRFKVVCSEIIASDGYRGFYKGLTPRLLRVAPGQAITFMVYEKVRGMMESWSKNVQVEGADPNYE